MKSILKQDLGKHECTMCLQDMNSAGVKLCHFQTYVIWWYFPSPPLVATSAHGLRWWSCTVRYTSPLEEGGPAPFSPTVCLLPLSPGLILVYVRSFPEPTCLTSTAERWSAENKWSGPQDWISSVKDSMNTRSGANPGTGSSKWEEQSREDTLDILQGQWALRSSQKLTLTSIRAVDSLKVHENDLP